MKKALLVLSRCIWSLWIFSGIWNAFDSSYERIMHPFNLVFSAVLFVGFTSVWIRLPWSIFIAAICGIVGSAMVAVQFYVITTMFTGDYTFKASAGPLEIKGLVGKVFSIGPAIALFISSAILLWTTADVIDKKNEKNGA